MINQTLTINLDLNRVHGTKAAMRELNKLTRTIKATSEYGFTIQDWKNKEIRDRFGNDIGTVQLQ